MVISNAGLLNHGVDCLIAKQFARLQAIEKAGAITEDDKRALPGVHFCDDWDGLPIFDGSPEKECCGCDLRRRKRANKELKKGKM